MRSHSGVSQNAVRYQLKGNGWMWVRDMEHAGIFESSRMEPAAEIVISYRRYRRESMINLLEVEMLARLIWAINF